MSSKSSSDIALAVKWLKDGKKVRRSSWRPGVWIRLVKTNWGIHVDGNSPDTALYTFCNTENVLAEDWEIFHER